MKLLGLIIFSLLLLSNVILVSCSGDDPEPVVEPEPSPQPVPEPQPVPPSGKKILLFVSHHNTYYSEYVVMKEALTASGYDVDVRSAATGTASSYMVPAGTTIEETANSLTGSSYSQFLTQFKNSFGSDWKPSLNTTPASIPVAGRIQDVTSMDAYAGLVLAGGTGTLDYRVDGSYQSQGSVSAADIQAAAEKLNALALQALQSGKPVMAQCHGASLAVYWKVNGMQKSLLAGQNAAGFPEAATATAYAANEVTYRANDVVVVSSPTETYNHEGMGTSKIITTRDWYPQSVAHAARTLINILETYPTKVQQTTNIKVLLLHGGSVDISNCGAGNRQNDVPCNYGGGSDLPADFTHVKGLLTEAANDGFSFTVTEVNLTGGTLPFTATSQSSVENYLSGYDVIIFFKHWSTGITEQLQRALVSFAENGGGVLGLHHALYNDVDDSNPALNKNILVNDLFGTQSAEAGWGANRSTYKIYSVNHGHFISTYRVTVLPSVETPGPWSAIPLTTGANASLSVYPNFDLFDEIYTNKVFVAGQQFGRGEDQITPLFSNSLGGEQMHTEGFAKVFNPNNDAKIGRVVFLQPGETRANFSVSNPYGQVIRNSVVWLAN